MRLSLRDLGLFGLAGVIILVAMWVARMPAPDAGVQGYSVLYLAPSGNGAPNTVSLGVTSDEFRQMNYRVELQADGKVLQQWDNIALQPGQSWGTVLELPNGQINAGRIEARLYRLDAPGVVYRYTALVRGRAGG